MKEIEFVRDPMTQRIERAQIVERDTVAEIAALRADVAKLTKTVEAQQVALLGALNTLQQVANLPGIVDSQASQMFDGLDRLARMVGCHNFSREVLGIRHQRPS